MKDYTTIEAQLQWLKRHNHPCLDAIQDSLKELKQLRNSKDLKYGTVDMVRVLDVVCRYFEVHPNEVISEGRHKGKLNEALQIAMYLSEIHTTANVNEISRQFNRHHSILSHVRGKVRDYMSVYPI